MQLNRKKQIAKDKLESKNDIQFVGKLLEGLLLANDFTNEQLLQIVQEHKLSQESANGVTKTIRDFISELKGKQIQTIINQPKFVEILKAIEVQRPEWIKELKTDTSIIEGRLASAVSAIEEIKFPEEIEVKNEITIKKPSWYKAIDVMTIISGAMDRIENFFNDIIDRRIIKIKSEKPLDVRVVDARGRTVDFKSLGGGVVQQGGGFIMSGGGAGGIFGNMKDGRKTITTAGTREQLADGTPCSKVMIMGMWENTGYIVVGGATVVAASATRQGIPIQSGQSIEINIDDLSKIYLDSEVSGEGVTFIYF